MHKMTMDQHLITALSRKLGQQITHCQYGVCSLQGGTLAQVDLLTGTAQGEGTQNLPFHLVHKRQKTWARPGDPLSWRREYDLQQTQLGSLFTSDFSWPACHLALLEENNSQLYMDYSTGVSGEKLNLSMLEQASHGLGALQAHIFEKPETLGKSACLSSPSFLFWELEQWYQEGSYPYAFLASDESRLPKHVKTWLRENPWDNQCAMAYNYLRDPACHIPEHLKDMVMALDLQHEAVFDRLKRLPLVLVHRDFWIENIICQGQKTTLIDWDCAGWGLPGEDLASLILDDTPPERIPLYFERLIPAYVEGLANRTGFETPSPFDIWHMMLLKFGYRLVQAELFAASATEKAIPVQRLQHLYDIQP